MPAAAQIIQPKILKPSHRPHHSTAVQNARIIQELMLRDMNSPKTSPAVRASLARSWVLVQSLIQELRGIPKPGQLRPDLDPVQLSRALKRMKSRKPILDIGDGGSGPSETPAEAPAEKPAKVQASKTPLQTTGLTPKPKDPLDKPPIEERVEPSKASEQSNEDPKATKE